MKSVLDQIKPLSYIKNAINNQPWYLILYVTSHCNQRCNMCFAWEMLNTLKKSQEWTLDEFKKISKEFPNLYQLSLTGGEPTLREDLAEIIKIFYKSSNVKRITIPTNGFFPDRIKKIVIEVMESCPDLILSINMSIDGLHEVHDRIRGLKNSFSNLVKSYHTVFSLQSKYKNLHLATASVLTISNKDSMKETLDWIAANMDIGNHGLMLARGDVKSSDGAGTDEDIFIDALKYHRQLSKTGSRIRDAVSDEYTLSRIETIKNKKMKDPCKAGKKLLVITETGNVLPCEILKVLAKNGETNEPSLTDFSYGNIKDVNYNLQQLLYSERGLAITKYIADERCWCSFECAQINNFALNPDAYMRTLKRVITGKSL
jgi:MoaA/NifB/PqqE/SkfB family radical SAM enzyme